LCVWYYACKYIININSTVRIIKINENKIIIYSYNYSYGKHLLSLALKIKRPGISIFQINILTQQNVTLFVDTYYNYEKNNDKTWKFEPLPTCNRMNHIIALKFSSYWFFWKRQRDTRQNTKKNDKNLLTYIYF